MNSPHFRSAPMLVAFALALSACSGAATGGVPATGAAPAAVARQTGDTSPTNVGGQYAGTVDDSVYGSGSAGASLAQYGAGAGGDVAFVYGTQIVNAQIGAQIASGNALPGTIVAGSRPCSFNVSATYDAAKHKLTGSYAAFSGCKGETGQFSLKEQCYYVRNRGGSATRRPDTPGLKPCGK